MGQRVVIVGGDAAGMSAASKAKRTSPDTEVIVLEKGVHISYAACGIPYFIGGVVSSWEDLIILTPKKARESRKIDVRTLHLVESFDPKEHVVRGRDLEKDEPFELTYDKLILATGARPVIPKIQGMDLPGVFTMRSIEDGLKIKNFIDEMKPKTAIVVGGGYIGLEMLEAFHRQGIELTIVERLDRLMVTVDEEIAQQVEDEIRRHGIEILLRTTLVGIRQGKENLEVLLAGGPGKLSADMVLVSAGVQPNSELAKDAGARLGRSSAIRINEKMETTLPDVYAAGDCVEHKHIISGRNTYIPLAPAANKGGRVAGENAVGGNAEFPGIIGTSITKVFDLEVARSGLSYRDTSETVYSKVKQVTVVEKNRARYYPGAENITIRLIVDKRSNKLLGAQIIGREGAGKRIDVLAVAIQLGLKLDEISSLDLAYAPPFSPVYDPITISANVGLHK